MEEDTKTAIWLVVGLLVFSIIMAMVHNGSSGSYSNSYQDEARFEQTQKSQMLY